MIVEREIDPQPRMNNEKIGDRGAEFGEAEIGWRDDAQFAARLVMQLACRVFGFFKIGKDPPALFIEGAPSGGRAHAPRRAIEKPSAEAFLKLEHMFACCRAGQAKPFGRSGKPTGLDDGDENFSVFKAIHPIKNRLSTTS